MPRLTAALVAAVLLAGCGAEPDEARLPDFTDLAKQAAPSVVNVSAAPESDSDEPGAEGFEDWFRRFFEDGPAPPSSRAAQGSGFVISEDGHILTSRHVVRGAGEIEVTLSDRRRFVAELVGEDAASDLAVLKIDADDLDPVTIGDPAKLEVGAWVMAIGSPFGFETSVTAGIVSAKQRSLVDDQYVPFIQTDVAINPGNSGGPLFNLQGEVVGINAQIFSRSGGFQGVSFAIPIDVAMDVAKQLRDKGRVARGWLGVQIQEVDPALAESFGMDKPTGALVARVFPGSPAEAAGFRDGDVILAFGGHDIPSAAALPPRVGSTPPGEEVDVTVLRDGERQRLGVTLGELPEEGPMTGSAGGGDNEEASVLGLRLRGLTDEERRETGLEQGGVRVVDVDRGAGADAGLRPGDVILGLGAERIRDAATLRERLAGMEGSVALLVWRDGTRLYLALDTGG